MQARISVGPDWIPVANLAMVMKGKRTSLEQLFHPGLLLSYSGGCCSFTENRTYREEVLHD